MAVYKAAISFFKKKRRFLENIFGRAAIWS
jgi:hypothetical protein